MLSIKFSRREKSVECWYSLLNNRRWIGCLKLATRSARPVSVMRNHQSPKHLTATMQPQNWLFYRMPRRLDVCAASIPRSLDKQIAPLCLFNSTQEKSTLFIIDKSDLHNKIRLYRCACELFLSPLSIPFNKEGLLLVLKLVEFGIVASRHRGLAPLWIINLVAPPSTANHQSTNNRFYSGIDLTSQCIIILPNHES